MPYWLESDTFADDPVWEVLAGGSADRIDSLQAAYARLKAKASHLKSDGYLTDQTALRYCRGRRQLLDRLATAVLERPPLLHRRGDECDCLGDSWIDGYTWRIHNFLKRNPSRTEYDRNRAQKADLRDARLKAAVYTRDGGCCRYCRSGPLSPKAGRARDLRKRLHHDHVDPDQPAGPDGANLVIACQRCNDFKGHRTPEEADLRLLPEPTAAERAAWEERGQALFDPEDHQRITDGSPTDQHHDADRITETTTDPISDETTDPNNDPVPVVRPSSGPVRPDDGEHSPQQPRAWSGKGPGAGRGGDPALIGASRAAMPTRDASAPDIYHRRSRAPSSAAAPVTEYVWPPGSVPATQWPHPPQPDQEPP